MRNLTLTVAGLFDPVMLIYFNFNFISNELLVLLKVLVPTLLEIACLEISLPLGLWELDLGQGLEQVSSFPAHFSAA